VASDSRALTLKLLADTADFQKKLEAGSKDVESIGDRVTEFGKKAALAFAAAGAAVGAFAVSAVKAAAEDEAAQRQLANTIAATTNATAAQIAGVEQYIEKTSIAIGVTDDQLRPAFSRLVRSTNDVEAAQKLLNLALDLSAATGKPLEAVSNALGRAYDGNTTALGKLGLGIDAATLKSKDFDSIFQQLTGTFGSFAENEADTTQKQMERVKIALDEAKESIGAALLPAVQDLTAWIMEYFVPALEAFIYGLTGQGQLDDSLTDAQKTALDFGKKVNGVINTVVDLKDELLILAGVIAGVFVVSKVAAAVSATIALINGLIRAYNLLKASSIVAGVASAFALNPLLGVGAAALAAGVLSAANAISRNGDVGEADVSVARDLVNKAAAASGSSGLTTAAGRTAFNTGVSAGLGGASSSSGSRSSTKPLTLIEQVTQENFLKNMATGAFDPGRFRRADEAAVVINVNAPSIVDREGFTRALVDAMNESKARLGGGGAQLVL
jgi:hypothetical protein